MKTVNFYSVGFVVLMIVAFSQQSLSQLTNFYSSPNYSNFISTMIDNSIWKSSMENYTKGYKGNSSVSKSPSSITSKPEEIPEYRRYRAVQFKPTGTRLVLQEYLDAVQINAADKIELKDLILKIFKEYEAEAAAKGYPNDWALAFVSYVGLNSHVYNGNTEKLIIPFEQNVGLRDVVAEYATDNGLFNNVTDQKKQELYELMIIAGGLTYHYYEKACREKNGEDIKSCRLSAEQNLKIAGIIPSLKKQDDNSSNNQTIMNGSISMNDYEFIPPENWETNKNKDFISIKNPRSGCIIQILTPQPSSGNMEQDANAVFEMMYKGWSYQQQGEKSFLLSTGILPKGQEYFMKEGTMTGYNGNGQYLIEEGVAMVVKAGSKIVIIAARHNSSSLGHDECYRNYNTWRRFINSFSIKNILPEKNNAPDARQRILGLWKIISTGVVSADYVFAANGNYEHGGGIGSSTTTSDMYYKYIYNRAYPFQGSGSYTISGDQLLLKKRSENNTEQIRFRFEKINHGGAGWKDKIWLLKKDNLGESEVCYEKETKE